MSRRTAGVVVVVLRRKECAIIENVRRQVAAQSVTKSLCTPSKSAKGIKAVYESET